MSFNIGLSALYAAQQDINITGNNIANASTTGFKQSRANFGDVYAASVVGGGSGQQGSGVMLQDVSQSFAQGNISFTNNTLDMGINGEGFFVLRGESGVSYSRAGAFGTDRDGHIVNSIGERLQGFQATGTGQATGGGPLGDLVISTGEIAPRPTTEVESVINLDASALPSSIVGTTLATNFGRSGEPNTEGDNNGFGETTIAVTGSDGVERLLNVPEHSTANNVAQIFSGVNGVTARGTTVAYITDIAGEGGDNEARFYINGREFVVNDVTANYKEQLAENINDMNNISARVNEADQLEITHSVGSDLAFSSGTNATGSLTIAGSAREADDELTPVTPGVQIFMNGDPNSAFVGGTVDFTLDENVSMRASDETVDGELIDPVATDSIFGDLTAADALTGVPFETGQFDPRNPDTYYRSTSLPIYDSLGNQHSLNMFFVRERPDAGEANNVWSVYLQVGGEDIGYDPNSVTGEPVLSRHEIRFTDNGSFDTNQPPIEITNWTPMDGLGRQVGAGPVPGNPNVSEQITNSNFRLDLSGMTQFGGDFSVQSMDQDGFSKGQLTGLEITDRGLVSARFSNGQSRAIGEVALANFANAGGLSNLGGTRFAETSESGNATVSGAGTAGLGVIQSGALEESNVDLPEQLVQLIVSQRNYQAAAQVISATDTATQTVINL